MTRMHDPRRLNLPALARQEVVLAQTTQLSKMERLMQELQGLEPDLMANLFVQWQARAEYRSLPGKTGEVDLWLHLEGTATLPLVCQRCLHRVDVPLVANQWFRFVETEAVAMAEDDDCEEDLLVLEPQFDLLAVLEDELLMALPLVPMHETCPEPPVLQADFATGTHNAPGAERAHDNLEPRRNPFAVLAGLKKDMS